jgi:concanavalin A-like lectin/glucanase superfamily protein
MRSESRCACDGVVAAGRPRVLIYHCEMWCGFVALVALGACGFESLAVPADATRDTTVRPPDAAIDGAPGTNPPSICDTADPNVIACYRFDGDTKDSTTHHLDATMTNVSYPAGQVGQAILVGATSAADVPDDKLFDVTQLTIEAWIKPMQLPSNGNTSYIIDVDRQYNLRLHPDGSITSTLVGGPALTPTTGQLTVGQWAHVAVTYDGNTAAIYIDGVASATATGGGKLGTNGDTGMSIAADNNPTGSDRAWLIGSVDELRLMKVARTAAQICADAGKSSCP